jgi:hypothetical protein
MPTLCFTGMDRTEETKLKLLFSDANEWLGGDWNLVAEGQAKVIVVDMDSIYGHMTWLKVHNSGKYVIAISSRAESEAEHVLMRPVTVESLVAALNQAVGGHVTNVAAITGSHAAVGAKPPAAPPVPAPRPEAPRAPAVQAPPPPTPAAAPPKTQPAPDAPPAPAPARRMAPAREPVLWDYLQPGGLQGPSKFELPGAPALVVDPRTDSYVGNSALKPYIPYCELASVRAEKWQPLNGADVNKHLTGANVMQPLTRLRWLHALVQGHGALAPGHDPDSRFRLTKWPKTEREFPKHLRIATTMMQTPGTPAEIAAKSDTPLADVNDFINASLETGYAEVMSAPPSGPASAPKTGGGLLGRLRGTR